MKCGTSSLFAQLSNHPDISGSRIKEPEFFARDSQFNKGLDWYWGLFGDQGRIALEASTAYTKHPMYPEAPERIRRHVPNAKLIYVIRNPLRRIESHARHSAAHRDPSSEYGFDAGIPEHFVNVSSYACQLDRYRWYHERDQLLIVPFEELIHESSATLQRIAKFLGVSAEPLLMELSHKNSSDSKQVRKTPAPILRQLASLDVVQSIYRRLLPLSVRKRIFPLLMTEVEVEGRFELTGDEKKQVVDQLRGDLTRLRDEYGVDVESLWKLRLE
jgi:hypothetical protein